jgi:hypothetical protein
MIATVTDLNFTPASIPTGYVSILVLISQSCKASVLIFVKVVKRRV